MRIFIVSSISDTPEYANTRLVPKIITELAENIIFLDLIIFLPKLFNNNLLLECFQTFDYLLYYIDLA